MVFRRNSVQNFQIRDYRIPKVDSTITIGFVGIECLDYTVAAIKSIKTTLPNENVRVVYIDNGSSEQTIEKIKQKLAGFKYDFFVIVQEENIVGAAWNKILQFAKKVPSKYALICNNDIIFSSYTIDGLISTFEKIEAEDDSIVMLTGSCVSRNPNGLDTFYPKDSHEPHPDFACMLLNVEKILSTVGEFNECFKPAYFEDNAFHARIILSGYKAFATAMAPYCHICSRTRTENPSLVTHNIFRINRDKFYEIFNVKTTDQEESEHKYNEWLKENPEIKHPTFEQIMHWWVNKNNG